jgi:hypothetical protein
MSDYGASAFELPALQPIQPFQFNMSPQQAQLFQSQGALGAPGALGQFGGPMKLGFNMPTANALFSGLQTIGGLWGAWNANKLAKKAHKASVGFANRNLENSTAAYNAHVEDIGRSRAKVEGMSPAMAQDYLNRTRLRFRPVGE